MYYYFAGSALSFGDLKMYQATPYRYSIKTKNEPSVSFQNYTARPVSSFSEWVHYNTNFVLDCFFFCCSDFSMPSTVLAFTSTEEAGLWSYRERRGESGGEMYYSPDAVHTALLTCRVRYQLMLFILFHDLPLVSRYCLSRALLPFQGWLLFIVNRS